MLAAEDVVRALPEMVERLQERLERMRARLAEARAVVEQWSADAAAGDALIERAMAGSPRPFALSLNELPAATFAPARVPPCTVVAADGSTIPVDRYGPLPCYVVNIGEVAIPYGVPGEVRLAARAYVGPPAPAEGPDVTAGGLDLLRDVGELEAAVGLAVKRVANGPVVALLDGTLFPWDLDSPQVDPLVRAELRDRTAAALDTIRTADGEVALGSYVSGSRSADVVTSLRCLAGDRPYWPQSDAMLFRWLLADGERSAVFRARSDRARRVEQQFTAEDDVCFFYFRSEDDIARVELPRWATTARRLQLLHAALDDQCRRCGGYPRALQEAHEQAVVTGSDRDLFEALLEKEAARAGVHGQVAGKAASKRRRML